MKLNCDLGEGLDEVDALIMPKIDMASIACGGHTGNAATMQRAIRLALTHKVEMGAHPSYPDRESFGRISIQLDRNLLTECLQQQVSDLVDCARGEGAMISFIKPHGALYNDVLRQPEALLVLLDLSDEFNLPLVLQAHPNIRSRLAEIASNQSVVYEAFVDRMYCDDGTLAPRNQPNAVIEDQEKIVAQAKSLVFDGGTLSVNSYWLPIEAQTLCIHSDSPNAVANTLAIRNAIANAA